ncbi:putative flavin-containing monooxygenase [Naematelia encephala]|uniref:Putative flavin-containing monooxygenase n=1 Tax=Naematelia encephala TaxID=71784 RepID=A0A1Y2B5R6_9TREE|nr:putative flavin-containing monooxygenase [Naematelia encephala]
MAPIALNNDQPTSDVAELKAKLAKFRVDHEPAVADNFMYDFTTVPELPTIDRLGVDIPQEADASQITSDLVKEIEAACVKGDGEAFASLFYEEGVWRDKIAFTWEYRTFNGKGKILSAAKDLLPSVKASNFAILTPAPKIDRPYPDLSFIQAHLSFDTGKLNATAVVHIIRTKEGYRIWTLHTVAEALKQFPELPNRDGHMTGPLSWVKQRELEHEFDKQDPDVLIIGGGHNGLMMAARLKALGVPSLIIERNARIGDNWRLRYEALSLHFPHWADHFPYMPFPDHWPTYTPAAKLGDWLEWYYSAQELYAWCSSSIVSASQEADGSWTVEVDRAGKTKRTLHPKHIVMATSLAGVPYIPDTPGASDFKGTIRHSTEHDSSREWVGKKVLVVGTSSSGFDTAFDFSRRGIDVTILQRSATYVMSLTNSVPRAIGHYEPKSGSRPDLDECDRISYAMPVGPSEPLGRRFAQTLEELDAELLDGMEARGFKTWRGQRGTGVQTLGYTKNGGFYFDAGACEHIINGKIKVEQGYIDHYTHDKVVLNGDREREFDLVVNATGFSNTIDSVRRTLGDDVASRCKPIWGMDAEGELNSAYKDCGVPNLWIMVGTLQHGRYHSKRVALRIKALLEGIADPPYQK